MKHILCLLICVVVHQSCHSQDNYLSIIEPNIGKSQAALKLFLAKALKGSTPGKVIDGGKNYYTLDNNEIHAEYFIKNDSCFYATILFKNDSSFVKAQKYIEKDGYPFRDFSNYYKWKTKSGGLLYYSVHHTERLIIAADPDYYRKPD